MTEFDCWAPYYDLIHKGLPGEVEFYVGQAVRMGGKTLELGCGTGRIAVTMAMSGVDVVGLDWSGPMLDLCREKLEAVSPVTGSLCLVEADMTSFRLDTTFDFIAMAYRTFMHLENPEEQRSCLHAVHRHLKAGGVFILNTWIPKSDLVGRSATGTDEELFEVIGEYAIPGTEFRLRNSYRAYWDEFEQRIDEEHLLEELNKEGVVLRCEILPLRRVWTTVREMDNLVARCGFTVEEVFGDFDCNPLTSASPDGIWVLRKSEAST